LEPVFGVKGDDNMKKTVNYKDEPINFEVIEDFLPRPSELVPKEDRVNLTLNKRRIKLFKSNTKYHKMRHETIV